jgi:hypothetical protein
LTGLALPAIESEREGSGQMSLFSRNREMKVQGFVLKLVNIHCPGLISQFEDARRDNRVTLAIVAVVVPLKDGRIQANEAFTAITKDFSSSGVAIILETPIGLDQAILGFRIDDDMSYVRATAKHLNPIGGGFFQLGFQLQEVVAPGDYPGLVELRV